jgi:hypothetical protein
MSHVSLPLLVCISPERDKIVKSTTRPKNRNAVNSLDQIPIRIPTINTPQLAHSTGPIDDFRAFENLCIKKTKRSH